jgi:hypothetical protein
MKVKCIETNVVGESGSFNTSSLSEIIVHDDNGSDSVYMRDYLVLIDETWMTFTEAFTKKLIITDNHNTCFFEPKNEEDKERGYSL